jgi:2-succinyl-5-enolpyruvyl-6-hydroxy-3-cyclohexene-1-carboxylate synthase
MNRANSNTALASAFTEELARSGVGRAVISPGSRSTPLAVALYREPGIEATVVIDERSAGFFALGAAQVSGEPVALLCTSGTAAANYHPAVAEADLSAIPLLVLTADRPPELRDTGAGQTIDQIKLYGDSVRWFSEVGNHRADDAGLIHFRSTACRAVATAVGDPRPGPVHLNFPWREPLSPVEVPGDVTASTDLALEGRGDRPLTKAIPARTEVPLSELKRIARLIETSPRGLILAGRRRRTDLREPLAALAAATGYPVLAEPTSQFRLGPHDRESVISTYDRIVSESADGLAPELVLRFGETPTSKRLRQWIASRQDLTAIIFDEDYGWYDPTRSADWICRGSGGAAASALSEMIGRAPDTAYRTLWTEAERRNLSVPGELPEGGMRLTEEAVHRHLGRLYRDGEVVYTSSSMPIRDQEAFLPPASTDVTFLANRGANGIDGLISSGLGAAAASGRPTTIVTGDVGLLHDIGGLALFARARSEVRIVVINNGGGTIFERLPQKSEMPEQEFRELMTTPPGIEPARAASLFGIPFRRVTSPDELEDAFADGSFLIEIPV